jgi:hypothetical protein
MAHMSMQWVMKILGCKKNHNEVSGQALGGLKVEKSVTHCRTE